MKHDAANNWSAFVTEPHIVVVLVPKVRTTAFTCRYNKLCVIDLPNVPSMARVAAGAFGFLIFNHAFDDPDLYGALSFFETMSVTVMPSLLGLSPNSYRRVTATIQLTENSFSTKRAGPLARTPWPAKYCPLIVNPT